MMYVVLFVLLLACLGAALFFFLKNLEAAGLVAALTVEVEGAERTRRAELETWKKAADGRDKLHRAEADRLRAELAKLDAYRQIPDVMERAKRTEKDVAARLEQARREAEAILADAMRAASKVEAEVAITRASAQAQADAVIAAATQAGEEKRAMLVDRALADGSIARSARSAAEAEAAAIAEEARKASKEVASAARKEAKEKVGQVERTLEQAIAYALEVRRRADRRAEEVGGRAYTALKDREANEATAAAMKHAIEKYQGEYQAPADHVLDDLAYDYGFHKAGERLKVARDRTRLMVKGDAAADCNYPEGWRRDYAVKFVLGAFNGQVDALLARIKPAGQAKLAQEIRDIFALVNHNGEVFRNTKVRDELLEARLEELKWGAAVARIKEKDRDEQRAAREQIREEEKARKEHERAVKQAQREEELLNKALDKARRDHASASAEDRFKYEAKLAELAVQLHEAEEKNRRAISMARQTKTGHVYVISNVGSFGEDVYKIGLTRRLDPSERVRELGDASVPFGFDVHAMIRSEDAPALEADLHRRFAPFQVNKANRRKEFFRVKLRDIQAAVAEGDGEVRWTLAAEAKDYRETLAMERRMVADPAYRDRWADSQAVFESPDLAGDEDFEGEGEREPTEVTIGGDA